MHIPWQDRTSKTLATSLLIFLGALVFELHSWTGRLTPLAIGADTPAPIAADQRPLSKTEQMIWSLQEHIRRTPNDVTAYAHLGAAYLQRARETGDPAYYSKTERVLATALAYDPENVETLIGQGSLALARHDFRAALRIGEEARALNPSVPRIYGVIVDAQVELGMYDQAVESAQTMVDMHPDLSSYSRASYLRELYGDRAGAIEAMQWAVTAGGPTAENTQWVRVQLGNLLFNQGDLAAAEQQYQRALAYLPDYVHALAGLARVRAAQGRYDEAIELGTRATQQIPIAEYVIALGDVYAVKGDMRQAQRQYDLIGVIDKLLTVNGVNIDLETALFFADHDLDLPRALQQARAAYAARPSIQAADVLAWTLFKTGNPHEAQQYANAALKLGTQDALKLFHAGMIAAALDQRDQANAYLRAALSQNPQFSPRWSRLAATTLKQIEATSVGGEQ